MNKPSPDRILITGASGSLGAALARHYAAPGRTLVLWGRDAARLGAVASTCRQAGAAVVLRQLELTDCKAAIAAVEEEDDAGAITLALLVAGAGDVRAAGDLVEDAHQIARLGLVNFVAPSAIAAALARRMAQRGGGGIVLVGSAAAFHALPFAAGYAGSKAGLLRFGEALRLSVRQHGVRVTVVSPGFIDTPASRSNAGPRPFEIQPADAAARIAAAAARGQGHVIFPWPFVVLRWFDRLLPPALRDRLLTALIPRGE
ncbi:SDR family NAD(P)-dependent oxidoreductase [Sphingomonas sp. PvP056]|jgi:short-subunit dehydrogenase|uniref:SDR family NAD(P)-dependent oxidoreductase n=1 Tax=Sphingomonas sp. PvP056 TaxID=3156392 RepID=UPI0033987A04